MVASFPPGNVDQPLFVSAIVVAYVYSETSYLYKYTFCVWKVEPSQHRVALFLYESQQVLSTVPPILWTQKDCGKSARYYSNLPLYSCLPALIPSGTIDRPLACQLPIWDDSQRYQADLLLLNGRLLVLQPKTNLLFPQWERLMVIQPEELLCLLKRTYPAPEYPDYSPGPYTWTFIL